MSKKIILVYFIFLIIFSLSIYFFVFYHKKNNFSPQNLQSIIFTPSSWRTKYLSPCDAIIVGEPDSSNWVKITFHCPNGVKNSTFVITALKQRSWKNIINEYARIIGFSSSEVFDNKQWTCYSDRKTPLDTLTDWDKNVQTNESIDCLSQKYNFQYLKQYYGL